jgi:hypothetical protein
MRPWIEAPLMPARAEDSSTTGSARNTSASPGRAPGGGGDAARAPRSARVRHQPPRPSAGEAVSPHPTSQEVSELPFHEVGQRGALRVTADRLEEGVEALVNHAGPLTGSGTAYATSMSRKPSISST